VLGPGMMSLQSNPEAIPFGIAAAFSGALAVFAWRRRALPMAPAFATMMAGESAWALFETLELVIADLPTKNLCYDLRLTGTLTAILGALAFVLGYTGQVRWLGWRRFGALIAPAPLLILLAATNNWHHLYWSRLDLGEIGGFNIAIRALGAGYWASIAYSYTITAVSIVLLLQAVLRLAGVYQARAAIMLFGVLVPLVIDLMDWSNIFGFIHVDTVSLSFLVTGLAFLPGLFRYRLLDLTPVAWAAVVKGMNDPVVVIDPSGRIVELNPAAQRLAGRPYLEVLGVDAARVFSHWKVLAERLSGIVEHGESSFEIGGGDSEQPSSFDVQISRLGEAGFPSGWVVVLRDITEQKHAAEERVRMLHEQAARAEAESANRAKDRFLATLSHELRTPLSPVLATVTAMLGDSTTPDAFHTVLEMIRRNVVLEARLIDDLLDLARIGRGTLHLKREVIDAHEMVDHVIEICGDDLRQAQLQLELDLAARRHHVDADPIRFQQVLWNLIKNAIKFTPSGGQVTVRSRDREGAFDGEAAARLIIEVSDTGIGIEPDSLGRIFDIMEQGGTAATRQFGGLGLGLTLSRSIVEQLDGRLAAASAGVGLGATFTVEIPTVPAPATALAPATAPGGLPLSPANDPGVAPPHRQVRVLLVDDNQDTLKFLSTLLTRKGHVVGSAPDMASALRLASEADFDLLISDIELPDGSGLELMRTIRSRRPVPGIALSGFGSLDDVEQSCAAGFALHLTKPVDFRRLEQAIQQVAANAPAETLVKG